MNSRTLPVLVLIVLLAAPFASPNVVQSAMNRDIMVVGIELGWPSEKDVLAVGIKVRMAPDDVDALARKETWELVSQSPTSRKYRDNSEPATCVIDVRFNNGVVKSVTVDYTMSEEQFARFGEFIQKIKQVYIDRAERTEGKGENAVYISTARDGSRIRTKLISHGSRSFRIVAVLQL